MSRRTSVLMETHLSSWKHTLLLKEKLHFTKLPSSFNVILNHTQYTYLLSIYIYTYIYFHSWDFPIMSCLLCSNISLHLSYTIIVTIIYTKDQGKSRWHRHTMYWFIFQACMNPTNLGDGALASPCHVEVIPGSCPSFTQLTELSEAFAQLKFQEQLGIFVSRFCRVESCLFVWVSRGLKILDSCT